MRNKPMVIAQTRPLMRIENCVKESNIGSFSSVLSTYVSLGFQRVCLSYHKILPKIEPAFNMQSRSNCSSWFF